MTKIIIIEKINGTLKEEQKEKKKKKKETIKIRSKE